MHAPHYSTEMVECMTQNVELQTENESSVWHVRMSRESCQTTHMAENPDRPVLTKMAYQVCTSLG